MLDGNFHKRLFNRYAALLESLALVIFLSSIGKAERLPAKTFTVAGEMSRGNVFNSI